MKESSVACQEVRKGNWSHDGGNAGLDDKEDGINKRTWEVKKDPYWVSAKNY
jgi:hypothetical protein